MNGVDFFVVLLVFLFFCVDLQVKLLFLGYVRCLIFIIKIRNVVYVNNFLRFNMYKLMFSGDLVYF